MERRTLRGRSGPSARAGGWQATFLLSSGGVSGSTAAISANRDGRNAGPRISTGLRARGAHSQAEIVSYVNMLELASDFNGTNAIITREFALRIGNCTMSQSWNTVASGEWQACDNGR